MRFFREAETAGRLNHPNTTIYDVGEERGLAYIAMEYLKGKHLSDHTMIGPAAGCAKGARADCPHSGRARLRLTRHQVVHRDIKPANLMYEPATDILKITDFGIARITGLGNTRTGIAWHARPSFMSPSSSRDKL